MWAYGGLHGFAAGPAFYNPEAERYLCPFDEKEGEHEGPPEARV
ncbi:MAG TPA: hypothetical protein VMR14_11815 [Streptosporangiaceae bacterium]|jgi:hypothetical protein|nr:hypothetical protein [Streptosporangiaceae bacterium]